MHMKLRIVEQVKALLASYWFIPALCAAAAIVLALGATMLDGLAISGRIPPLPFFSGASPSGTRAILSTIAGSSISVAGVVFSIAMVVLSMASSQFGPRLLPNFFRRKSTQVVFGGFIATFISALLVLVQVAEQDPGPSPHSYAVGLSVTFAVLSFALLVYFLQSVTSFIQVSRIIDEVAQDLVATLHDATIPCDGSEEDAAAGNGEAGMKAFEEQGVAITAPCGGYIQAIDIEGVLDCASARELRIRTLKRAGHHVSKGDRLAMAMPATRFDQKTADALHELFVIGLERTNSQDAEYALDQLVEIALRALSPGINDPFTALNCIDRLGEALTVLAQRRFPPDLRRDGNGTARLLVNGNSDESMLAAAFNPLRQYGCAQPAVAIRLLETIAALGVRSSRPRLCRALQVHAERIRDACRREIRDSSDLEDIESRYRAAISAGRAAP